MKIMILVLLVMIGCFNDEGEEVLNCEEESPSIMVQVPIDGTYTFISSGHTVNLLSCHNDAGPCGGGMTVKIFSPKNTTEGIYIYGDSFLLQPLELPHCGSMDFIYNFSYSSIGVHEGQIMIESDDHYYPSGFVINLVGEKY